MGWSQASNRDFPVIGWQARNTAGHWGELQTLSLTTLSTLWCRWYDRGVNRRKQKGTKHFPGGIQTIFIEDVATGCILKDEFLLGSELFQKNCPRQVNGQKRWRAALPGEAERHTVGPGQGTWGRFLIGQAICAVQGRVVNFWKTESHKRFLFIGIKVFMVSEDTIDFYPVQMGWV